jgi:cytochrome P450
MTAHPRTPIPDHVPPSLVRPYPYIFGTITDRDPFNDLAAEIHRGPPVFWAEHAFPGGGPAWVVRRNEDLKAIYLDTDHFSNKDYGGFAKLIGETWSEVPTEIDPPMHGVYRVFVNPIFTPKALAKLNDRITQYAREYIFAFRDKGACEFMADFAFEFPIKVFLELMGLPLELTKDFLEWESGLLHCSEIAGIAAATRSVVDYLRGEIADRMVNPRDDVLTYGVQAEIEGRKLTDDELVGFAFNLFIGGLDTVSTHMGLQFLHLARHTEHQATLRAHPEMINDAVEEMMRGYAAVTTFRTCAKPIKVQGVQFLPGDKIVMATTLAGRDPEAYERPNEIILDRKAQHVAFAHGPHLCVGLHLARREMRIAMQEFLGNIPAFGLEPGAVIRHHLGMVQPVELPLVWDV